MKYIQNEKKIKNIFDKLAPYYDKNNKIISLGFDKFIKKDIIKYLNITCNSEVLDLCTGTGDIIEYILKMHNPKKIVGVDFSSSMLKLANKKLRNLNKFSSKIKLIKANVCFLPFKNETFDCVIISFGFRNIKNKIRIIKEIKRVLKSGGEFIHLDFGKTNIFIDFIFEFVVKYFLKFFYKLNSPYKYLLSSKKQFYKPSKLISIFKSKGFILEKRIDYLFGIISMQKYVKE